MIPIIGKEALAKTTSWPLLLTMAVWMRVPIALLCPALPRPSMNPKWTVEDFAHRLEKLLVACSSSQTREEEGFL